jgi:hypothetical protein
VTGGPKGWVKVADASPFWRYARFRRGHPSLPRKRGREAGAAGALRLLAVAVQSCARQRGAGPGQIVLAHHAVCFADIGCRGKARHGKEFQGKVVIVLCLACIVLHFFVSPHLPWKRICLGNESRDATVVNNL